MAACSLPNSVASHVLGPRKSPSSLNVFEDAAATLLPPRAALWLHHANPKRSGWFSSQCCEARHGLSPRLLSNSSQGGMGPPDAHPLLIFAPPMRTGCCRHRAPLPQPSRGVSRDALTPRLVRSAMPCASTPPLVESAVPFASIEGSPVAATNKVHMLAQHISISCFDRRPAVSRASSAKTRAALSSWLLVRFLGAGSALRPAGANAAAAAVRPRRRSRPAGA